MESRDYLWFVAIVALVAGAVWMSLNPSFPIVQGLDLQGGLQVLLAADVPDESELSREEMETVRQIIDQRINGLGVTESTVQIEGERRILVELPGYQDPESALSLIQDTALLEFVDTGTQPLPEGMCIRTSLNEGEPSRCEALTGGEAPTFETVLTGGGLRSATVTTDQLNQFLVAFELTPEAGRIFGDYTATHQGQFLTIVLDKVVVSSPRISAVIDDAGTITGDFDLAEAQQLALQLQYGSLPVPLRIEGTRQIGATLGAVSIAASIRAGTIGLLIVLLFLIVYYRLPGLLAALALLIYALFNFAIFKWLGVTMTLPAITGFLLSTGMAVDANILVFERMKEELRNRRTVPEAIESGFSRAWTSIRDSNIATLVICFILFIFGRNFGASIVTGFALTLAIGVFISLFTAIIVTRTFVRLVLGQGAEWVRRQQWLLGV